MEKDEKIPSYKFNSINNKWEGAAETIQKIPVPSTIKIVNLNVLFDVWKGKAYKHHVVRPLERFGAQFEIMQAIDSDVIVLNEVTANYIELLIQEKWVKDHYYLSDISGNTINGFGNLILSKFHFSALSLKYLIKLKRPIVCATIPFENGDFVIAASHFSALKQNDKRRQIQLKELTAYLDSNYANTEKVILGDVNFHTEAELVPTNYLDAWEKVNPNTLGYTFDGTLNLMLHEMWPLAWMIGFDKNIQMRLDRVFVQSSKWTPKEMELAFNTPVYQAKGGSTIFKDTLSVIFDWLGVNIIRKPKNYLFPSDHFGLITTFESC